MALRPCLKRYSTLFIVTAHFLCNVQGSCQLTQTIVEPWLARNQAAVLAAAEEGAGASAAIGGASFAPAAARQPPSAGLEEAPFLGSQPTGFPVQCHLHSQRLCPAWGKRSNLVQLPVAAMLEHSLAPFLPLLPERSVP